MFGQYSELAPGLLIMGWLAPRYEAIRNARHGELPAFAEGLHGFLQRQFGPLAVQANHQIDPQGTLEQPEYSSHVDAAPGMTHIVTCVLSDEYCGEVCGTMFEATPRVWTATCLGSIILAPLSMYHRSPACHKHRRYVLRYYVRVAPLPRPC